MFYGHHSSLEEGQTMTRERLRGICASTKTLHCVTFLDEPPGHQLSSIRRPSTVVGAKLREAENRLLRRVRPGFTSVPHIRGSKIAIDYVLQALLTHSKMTRFSFVVPDQRLADFQGWTQSQVYEDVDIRVLPFSHIVSCRAEKLSPDIWLNLHGDHELSFRLRSVLSERLYPTVTLQHGISAHNLLYDRFLRSMLTPSYACDSLVCTSEAGTLAAANIFKSLASSLPPHYGSSVAFKGRLDTIPLCVDTELFTPGPKLPNRKRLCIPLDAMMLLYVGFMSPIKAELAAILPVIGRLVADNPTQRIIFVIAGTGPDEYVSELTSVIRELGLNKYVQIRRDISDDVKLALLRSADIFVAPCESMQESFGLTPVEAMSCGLPQVVAAWSGYRETVVDTVTGFHIPTTWAHNDGEMMFTADLFGWDYDHIHQAQCISLDSACLYERLSLLVRNSELRMNMSKASRDRAVSNYSPELLARHYESLWSELIASKEEVHLAQGGSAFNGVQYWKYFGHFASHVLNGKYNIVHSRSAALSLDRVMRITHISARSVPMLDRSLLERILDCAEKQGASSKPCYLEDAVAAFAGSGITVEYVMRHIMVLVKYGLVMLIPGSAE